LEGEDAVFEFTVGFAECETACVQEEGFIGEGSMETTNDKNLILKVLDFTDTTSLSWGKELTPLDNETLPSLG
jgi:hypothetical protein